MHPFILLVNHLKKIGDINKVERYFDLQKQLLEFTGLKTDDPRLSMYVRKEGDISININSRRVLALVFRKRSWRIQMMINDDDLAEAKQFSGYLSREDEAFSNQTGVPASLIRFDLDAKPYENMRLMELWKISILDYLPTAKGSPYPKEHNACLFAATLNKQAQYQLLDWIKQGYLTEKELEFDEIKQLFNLDVSMNTPSVSHSNFDKNMPTFPLNQILFGPPGTGKTFNTINKALEIVGFDIDGKTRKEIKAEFDKRLNDGQIVFTTFHQSMSYEDFIEGIKPIPPKNGVENMVYDVQDGIFKQICTKAKTDTTINKTDNFEEAYLNFINDLAEKETIELETPSQKRKFNVRVNSNKNCLAIPQTPTATQMTITKSMIRNYLFEQKVDDWKPYTIPIAEYLKKNYPIKISDKLERNYPLSIAAVKLDFETVFQAYCEEMRRRIAKGILIELSSLRNKHKMYLHNLDLKGDAFLRVNNLDNHSESKHLKKDLKLIYQAYPNYINEKTFLHTVKPNDIKERLNILNIGGGLYHWFLHFKEFEIVYLQQQFTPDFIPNDVKSTEIAQNYVLIIDEINRGNVSQIFGELITLIEDDKRLGKDEALEVTLPYSKDPFGVPSNVYIIGTMNTADRSVEALDTALRRRFSFVEMPPQYNLAELAVEINGVKLSDILQTINKRIEKLLNKDHLIGHSYLMSVNHSDALKAVFQNKIMPLLQEYFFGDCGKIGLVLGNGFVEKEATKDAVFADFDYEDGNADFDNRIIYRLKNVVEMDDNTFETALNKLIKSKK